MAAVGSVRWVSQVASASPSDILPFPYLPPGLPLPQILSFRANDGSGGSIGVLFAWSVGHLLGLCLSREYLMFFDVLSLDARRCTWRKVVCVRVLCLCFVRMLILFKEGKWMCYTVYYCYFFFHSLYVSLSFSLTFSVKLLVLCAL